MKARLEKTLELLRSYDNIFEEQLKSGILEKVTKPGDVDNVMYLPHREVIKEGKLSTKLRIVFDASAKMSDQVSLNDVLYKGPCLTPLLFNMLLRFRVFPVAIIGDIEKAYLQISVAEKHRDFLRCVWYKDVSNKNPEILKFRFCRVIFGAAPSQFLLNGTIKRLLSSYVKTDTEFVKKVSQSFYVDDFCSGAKNASKGYELYKKVKIRFAEAKFNVRKWVTNDTSLMDLINREENV